MKKIVWFLLAVFSCFGLVACDGKKSETVNFDDMTIISIRNAETGDTINLGMSQGEIEDIIGKGEETDYGTIQYGTDQDGLNITYEKNVSTSFGIYGDNLWRLQHGIKAGDKVSDMFKYYGEAEIKDRKGIDGEYLYSSVSYSVEASGAIVESSLNNEFSIFVSISDDHEIIEALSISKN